MKREIKLQIWKLPIRKRYIARQRSSTAISAHIQNYLFW